MDVYFCASIWVRIIEHGIFLRLKKDWVVLALPL
jgi:hypothetical protein